MLLTVIENGLHPQAKFLYTILHAYADASGVAVVEEAHIAAIMHISPGRLRAYRSMLNNSGYCNVTLSAGQLIFTTAADRPTRESDRLAITPPLPQPESDRQARDDNPIGADPTDPGARPTRESDHQAITPTLPQPESDRQARDIALPTRESDRQARGGGDYRGGRLVGRSYSPPSGEKPLPTNQPGTPARPIWEIEASEGLLLAQGCENLPAIREIARSVPFEEVRAHALAWLRDTKSTGPGGLLHRIRSADFALPELTDDDRRTNLFRRWRTPGEIAAEESEREAAERLQREIDAERQQRNAQDRPPTTPPDRQPADEIWGKIAAELAATLPQPAVNQWLAGATGHVDDGVLTVVAANAYAREWLQSRLLPKLQRLAAKHAGRSMEVKLA